MKRKTTLENPDVGVHVSAASKRTKKKKRGDGDSAAGEGLQEEFAGEKKEKRKEKPAHVDAEEAADVAESRLIGEEEEEEELTPEEIRVLERKLKKIRKKEEKKKQKEEAKDEKEESKNSVAQTQALEYLTCWSEKREEWKFQKTRQVWLLQHMYDAEKVPDSHFSVLLSYLEGLRGVAREITVQKAEALVRFGAGPEGEEGGATEAQKKIRRARELVQLLS